MFTGEDCVIILSEKGVIDFLRVQPETPPEQPDLSPDPRWQLVQRIVHSPQFQRSVRLRDFLLHVTAEALHGRTSELSEHHIGCRVFQRQPDYSTADDNIVRVHARQLRLRLDEYFLLHGHEEPLVIEIPRGSYIPVFRERTPAPLAAEIAPSPPSVITRPRYPWYVLAAATLGTIAICVLAMQNWNLSHPATADLPPLLAAVLDHVEPTTVIIPDSGFGALRSTIGNRPPLTDYLEPGYPAGLIRPGAGPTSEFWIRTLTGRPYTTFPMVVITARLVQLAERSHRGITFRFARDVNSRDFNEGRFILLGSEVANPWVSLFETQLNFRTEWDATADRQLFRNVAPRPGEQPTYTAKAPNAVPGESFATVSLLVNRKPGRGSGATILLIQGSNLESTEAGADFVFDSKMSRDALHTAGAKTPEGAISCQFEAMLRTPAVTGAARDTAVVATRYLAER